MTDACSSAVLLEADNRSRLRREANGRWLAGGFSVWLLALNTLFELMSDIGDER